MEMDIVGSIADVKESDWKLLTSKSSIYLSLPYLQAIESGMNGFMDFRYITFYYNDQAVGVAAFQISKADKDPLSKVGEKTKLRFLERFNLKFLINGSLFYSGEAGYEFDYSKISEEESINAINEGVNSILEKIDPKSGINVIILKEFYEEHYSINDKFKEFSFVDFNLEPNMIINIRENWTSFESYLEDMTAKFRNKSTATHRKSNEIIWKEFQAADILKNQETIDALYTQVYDNADFKLGKINANTFASLKTEISDDFFFYGYYLEEKLIGFLTATKDRDILDANFIGLDYKLLRPHALYQRMLYDYVKLSIETKVKELNLGRTAGEIKSTVGAIAQETKCYIRMKNSLSNHLLKPIVRSIEQPVFSHRHPFKK